MSKLNYSTTTRDDNELSRTRGLGWTSHELSASQRSVSPSYQRLPMYTFSPNDRRNDQEHLGTSRGGRPNRNQTLIQSEVRSPRNLTQNHIEPRYSMTAGTRSAMISKLREMGQNIDQLMQRSSSASQELTLSLTHLKDLIEDVFCQVTAQLEDLKAENSELRAQGSAVDHQKIRRLEEHYQYKIMDLQAQKEELQGSLRRMQGTLERGQAARTELIKKARQTEQISKDLQKLQKERDSNRATISRLNAKINDLNAQEQEFKKRVSSQDEYLNQIKSEAKNAIGTNRNLERRLDESQGEINKLQRQVDLLDRKNRQLENEVVHLETERQNILKQSKQNMAELTDLKDQNKDLSRQLQTVMSKLKDQTRGEGQMKSELDAYKKQLETERRKTGQLKDIGRRQQQDFQSELNNERDKLGKRLQEQEGKYKEAEKRFADQMRKSDLIESQLEKYRKQLQSQRRRSNVLESEFQSRNKQFRQEKDGLLGKLQDQKRNFKKQGAQLGEYAQKLGKSEDLLKEFARQSDLQDKDLKDMKREMEEQRRKSTFAQQEAVKKFKEFAEENQFLSKKAQQNQSRHQKALDAMKDYEIRYKDAEKRFTDETRKSQLNQKKIRQIMAQMDETRRLSQLDLRDKADLIRKIENKNDQLACQIKEQQDSYKKKQGQFFSKNKELEKILLENTRKSDMMAQELLSLKQEYEKQRRKSMTYEQEQKQLNQKMRELGDKYASVSQKLEQGKDIYKNKEELYTQLDKKHKEIQRLFIDQTRKSQLDQEQLKALYDEIQRERRKSIAFEQESVNKIKDLLGKNNSLNSNLKEQQARNEKAAELMRRAEERAKQLESEGREWQRKSDMYEGESARFRDELENERRRSMVLEAEIGNRVKAMEKKNIELMQKIDEDRNRLGKSSEALKQAEIKYAKIEQILEDERRASQMSTVNLKKITDEYEGERRKSHAFEEETKKKMDELARRNRQIEQSAGDLEERLSISTKTVRSLETKASQAERSAEELSRMLDDVNEQKQKSDELSRRYKQEISAKQAVIRRQREQREDALHSLKQIENRMRETDQQIKQMTQAHQSLLREISEKQRELAQTTNNNEHLAGVLNELQFNQKNLNDRVEELYKVNVQNASTFQRNYQTLKSEIGHRDRANQEKQKRIQVLEQQVVQDSKRVVAINPTKVMEATKDLGPLDFSRHRI